MSVTVTIPTATSIKMRYPEFEDVDDYLIEFAVEEAREVVGSNWTTGYNRAIIYLTAHYVAAGVAAVDAANDDSGEIASESIGRMSISYKTSAASNVDAVASDLSSTSYGKRYVELRDLNFGGPVLI